MVEQRIAASALEIEGLGQRLTEHNAALKLVEDKERALLDAFKVFCGGHALPPQTRLLGVADGAVVVSIPEPPPDNTKS